MLVEGLKEQILTQDWLGQSPLLQEQVYLQLWLREEALKVLDHCHDRLDVLDLMAGHLHLQLWLREEALKD